ncbi:MAG: 2-oxo acid dehydrogenase subunit E2 [Chloroflexi bacterium]|nr:2-oxo acid dehydrogenase subunit E2 [Chloroflexota bacterium]
MADTVIMPKLGFDMAEGTLVRWVKNEGEAVKKGEVLAEIETDKATVEVESNFGGFVRRLLVDAGAVVPVGTPIAVIGEKDEKIEEAAEVKTPAAAVQAGEQPAAVKAPAAPPAREGTLQAAEEVRASPLARRIARDQGVDLSTIQGSGPGGRVTRRDIETAVSEVQPAEAPTPAITKPQAAFPAAPSLKEEGVPLARMRALIGRRMAESKQQVPHFYVSHEFDMARVTEIRQLINENQPDDQKITVNDFIVKASALALRQFPNLNASLAENQILRHGNINIGVAVATEAGLMTVVCHDADQKSLGQISKEVREMAIRARSGKVRPEDIEGSTFSISNLGMFDVENFIAIINPPEAAILAVGSSKQMPVVEDGQLKVGFRMKATISADHRVTDGAEAARFMQTLAQFLESPMKLLI